MNYCFYLLFLFHCSVYVWSDLFTYLFPYLHSFDVLWRTAFPEAVWSCGEGDKRGKAPADAAAPAASPGGDGRQKASPAAEIRRGARSRSRRRPTYWRELYFVSPDVSTGPRPPAVLSTATSYTDLDFARVKWHHSNLWSQYVVVGAWCRTVRS